MRELTPQDYENFGREFWDFYIENGFGNKSKADIDAEIYDIICQLGIVDDKKSALIIGRDLKATEASVKKYKESRFYKHKINDDSLKQQVREIFRHNQSKVVKGKIVFTVSNVAAKLYIEELLQQSEQTYDYTNNPSNISMNVETFVYVADKIGCDLDAGLNNIMENQQVTNVMGDNYITIQNIYNEREKTPAEKMIGMLSTIMNYAGLLGAVLRFII